MKLFTIIWACIRLLCLRDDLRTAERRYLRGLINLQDYMAEASRIDKELEKLKTKL